jgi:hypothetical protein
VDEDRLQEATNRAEETKAAQVSSDETVRHARGRSSRDGFRTIFLRALLLLAVSGVVLLISIVWIIVADPSRPLSWAGLVIWAAAIIGLNVAWFLNWRCPICGGYLGGGYWGMFSVRHCLNCGAELA